MKKFKLLAVALAALTMASCSKEAVDNNEVPINGETNVTVKLDIPSSTPSKAIDNTQTDKTKAVLQDGVCYFLDSKGGVVKQFAVVPATIISAAGQQFTGVPSSATKFYMVANMEASALTYPTPALGTTLSNLKKLFVLTASSQNQSAVESKSTSDKVVMEGESGTFTGTAPNMVSSVTLTPTMSRIEIMKITLKNITSATLEGIFINNIYTSIDMEGAKLPLTPVKETDPMKFLNTAFTGGMFDYDINGIGGSTTIKIPGTFAKATWAYQVIPSANAGTDDKLPHIVIKLKNIVAPGQVTIPTGFVTVTKYTRVGDVAVTSFDRSTFYRINNIDVEYAKIDLNPETQTINVTATVDTAPWVLNTITPVI